MHTRIKRLVYVMFLTEITGHAQMESTLASWTMVFIVKRMPTSRVSNMHTCLNGNFYLPVDGLL